MADDVPNLARAEDAPPEPGGDPDPSLREVVEGTLVWSSMDLPGMDPPDDRE